MVFRLASTLCLLLLVKKSVVQGQLCLSQDNALDSCLTAAGANEILKTACDVCIASAYMAAVVVGGDCASLDTAACAAFALCGCSTCSAEAEAKGICEVDAERASENIACPAMTCTSSAASNCKYCRRTIHTMLQFFLFPHPASHFLAIAPTVTPAGGTEPTDAPTPTPSMDASSDDDASAVVLPMVGFGASLLANVVMIMAA